MSREEKARALRLLAEHGIQAEPSDVEADAFGQFVARVGDDTYVVALDGYPAPFVEQELDKLRLGVRQRVRLKPLT